MKGGQEWEGRQAPGLAIAAQQWRASLAAVICASLQQGCAMHRICMLHNPRTCRQLHAPGAAVHARTQHDQLAGLMAVGVAPHIGGHVDVLRGCCGTQRAWYAGCTHSGHEKSVVIA